MNRCPPLAHARVTRRAPATATRERERQPARSKTRKKPGRRSNCDRNTVALPAWLLLSLRPRRPRRRRGWPALGSCPSPCCWRDMVKAVEPDLLRCLPYWTYKQISSGLILSILSQYRQRSGERTALLPVEACQLNAIRTSCKPRTKKNSPDTKLNSGKLVKRAVFR